MRWHEPLPREKEAARRQESPDYYKCSHLHSAKPSPEHLWIVEVLAGSEVAKPFLAGGCGARLQRTLHGTGPQWMWSCCEAQVSVRTSGSACEMWSSSVPDISLSHSSLATLLVRFSSSGFCGELVCRALGGAGDDMVRVPAVRPGFSQAAAQFPMAQFLLYPISKASWPPEEGSELAVGTKPRSWPPSACACTNKKGGAQMTYLMLEMNMGHCLARQASHLVGKLWFGLPFIWWLF